LLRLEDGLMVGVGFEQSEEGVHDVFVALVEDAFDEALPDHDKQVGQFN
jgi:hypothetical protein